MFDEAGLTPATCTPLSLEEVRVVTFIAEEEEEEEIVVVVVVVEVEEMVVVVVVVVVVAMVVFLVSCFGFDLLFLSLMFL